MLIREQHKKVLYDYNSSALIFFSFYINNHEIAGFPSDLTKVLFSFITRFNHYTELCMCVCKGTRCVYVCIYAYHTHMRTRPLKLNENYNSQLANRAIFINCTSIRTHNPTHSSRQSCLTQKIIT